MQTQNFNPDMLRLARDVREMTQIDLACKVGFTQALISKLENGLIRQPTDEVFGKLVEALNFPPTFFAQTERQEGFPHFHAAERARLPAKSLAHLNAVINLRRLHVTRLTRSYEIPVHKPIPMIDLDNAGLTPERLAERMREYWLIARGPVKDLTQVIEEAGGVVIPCRFGTHLLDGISFRSAGLPPIFCMNREVPGDRYRLALAQELGHIIMHGVPDDDNKMKEEAQRFAAAFLMPSQDIRAHISTPKLTTFGRAKAHWRVSIKSLVRRSHQLKLITDQQHRNLMVAYSKSFREGEPFPIDAEEPSLLREMVRYHLQQLGYSLRDLADLLHLNPEEAQRAYIGSPRGLRLVVSNV